MVQATKSTSSQQLAPNVDFKRRGVGPALYICSYYIIGQVDISIIASFILAPRVLNRRVSNEHIFSMYRETFYRKFIATGAAVN